MTNKKRQVLKNVPGKKIMLLALLASIIITLIILPLNVLLMKIAINFGQTLPDSFKIVLIDTENYKFSLNDFLILTTYFIQSIVTIFFSYLLWKSGEKSNKISEELKNNEINREKSILKENALIVYYDLKLGLSDLKKIYEYNNLHRKVTAPKKLFFSHEWIKNVAIMKDELDYEDIKQIYTLYGDLLTVKELLESKDSENLTEELSRIVLQIFDEHYLKYAHLGIDLSDIESVLNLKYQSIFEKLRKVLYFSSIVNRDDITVDKDKIIKANEEKIWCILDKSSNLLNGNLKLYNEDGKIRYYGYFQNGILINGMRYEYYDNGLEYIHMQYENSKYHKGEVYVNGNLCLKGEFKENKFWDGYIKLFDSKGNLQYEGNMRNGKYHGEGKRYITQKSYYKGEFKDGKFFNGINTNVLIYDSIEDYDLAREEYYEEYYEEQYQNDDYQRHLESCQEQYYEENKIGERIYADFQYVNGQSRIIEESKKVEGIYEFDK